MPSTTDQGYRIPLDADPVADLALAVRNLAQDIDDKLGALAAGQATISVVAAASGSIAVTWPAGRFGGVLAPYVVATVKGTTNVYYATVNNVGVNGCDIKVVHKDGASATNDVVVNWIAVRQ